MLDSEPAPHLPETQTMHGPATNRLHGYEAGWLTLLIEMRVETRREAQEAQSRVAQAASSVSHTRPLFIHVPIAVEPSVRRVTPFVRLFGNSRDTVFAYPPIHLAVWLW